MLYPTGMPVLRLLACLVVATFVAAVPARAQLCGPTDDPCVVTTSVTVPGGTVIDLGTRDLLVLAGRDITAAATGTGSLTILAGRIEFQDSAKIIAPGVGGYGGSVTLTASEDLVMAANSRIDVTAGSGGDIDIDAQSVFLGGQLRAVATAREGDGGFIDVTSTTGDITIGGGGIMVTGGNGYGFGGFVFLLAANHLDIQALIEAKGGEGGDVDIEAIAGDLTIGPTAAVNNNATLEANDGGDVSFAAGGTVAIQGPVYSRGQGSLLEGGGYGGDFDIIGKNVTIGAQIELVGAGPDGDGGYFDVSATEDITMSAPVLAMGAAEGSGGEVDLFAGRDIDVLASADVRGGFVGGTFDARATGSVTFASGVSINADFIPGFAFGGYGGIISVRGCEVTLPAGASLIVDGLGTIPRAQALLQASSIMTIGGTIAATSQVMLRHRNGPPTILGSAVITPAPVIVQDPTLPCCVGCPTTTTSTSTSTTTTTSTSTTSTSTTTTSTTSTSSTSTSSSSTSSTTTSVSTTSTSTTLPLTCLEEPLEGYEAIDCALVFLQETVADQPDAALGGGKSARRLAGKLAKARALVDKAQTASKAAKLLAKAMHKVASFEKQVGTLLEKGKIEDGLANELLDLSTELTVRINGVLAPLTN